MPEVYVHSAICETYLVFWYSIDLWMYCAEKAAIIIFTATIYSIYSDHIV